ncbi:MAG TPA: CinA family protein [Solimonas sp.]|nr:CinA family protein [Solimonas sp.]
MLSKLSKQVADGMLQRGQWLAVAESCTGGLVAQILTDNPGSSAWFERGLVTYSNLAKTELLDVSPELIGEHGAVSEASVAAMARGLLRAAPVDWGIAITGIAGPGGGSEDKPVGTVWIAWIQRGHGPESKRFHFEGKREAVREQAALAALEGLLYRVGLLG